MKNIVNKIFEPEFTNKFKISCLSFKIAFSSLDCAIAFCAMNTRNKKRIFFSMILGFDGLNLTQNKYFSLICINGVSTTSK